MKLVVTVVGLDRVGIIAAVSGTLARNNVNILSINQTIMDGYFNMILMGEIPKGSSVKLEEIQRQLTGLGTELGVEIRAQHEDIFTSMHRIG